MFYPKARAPPSLDFCSPQKFKFSEVIMKNYKDSDYAVNKNAKGIVYRFADQTVEVTLEDYLRENPGKTEADFTELKALSDSDYFERDRRANAQTKKNTPFDELNETALCCAPSPEDLLIGEIDALEDAERHERLAGKARRALDTLTEIQRRRYLMYHVDGMTLRQIAGMEGVVHSKIQKSVEAAEKKIKVFLANG